MILNDICKVPFAVQGNIFTGSRDEDMDIFGEFLFCLQHRYNTRYKTADF